LTRLSHAGGVRDKRGPHLGEQSHIQHSGQDADDSRQNAYPSIETNLKEFGDSREFEFAQSADHETRCAESHRDDQSHQRYEQIGEPFVESIH
jgi:hypothetical protein